MTKGSKDGSTHDDFDKRDRTFQYVLPSKQQSKY